MKMNDARCESRGATLVEFAVALPFFLLLVLSIMDLSRAFAHRVVLSDALRLAARYGATRTGDCTGQARTFFTERVTRFGMGDGATINGRVVPITGGGEALQLEARASVPCLICRFLPAMNAVETFHNVAFFPLERSGGCSTPH